MYFMVQLQQYPKHFVLVTQYGNFPLYGTAMCNVAHADSYNKKILTDIFAELIS